MADTPVRKPVRKNFGAGGNISGGEGQAATLPKKSTGLSASNLTSSGETSKGPVRKNAGLNSGNIPIRQGDRT